MSQVLSVAITTVTTTVPTGDDEAARRGQKLVAREQDLQAHGQHGYTVRTTVVIPAGDHVLIVDTLAREEAQQ